MSSRERRQREDDPGQNVPNNVPDASDRDTDPTDEMWSDAELERVSIGWRADDVPPEANDDGDDTEDDLDLAADALANLDAREMRRDQYHRTGGDDKNPGFDTEIDSNAPKKDDMPRKKRGGNKGQSDWH